MAELAALAELTGAGEPPPARAEAAFGGHHLLAVRARARLRRVTFRIRRYGEHGMELTRSCRSWRASDWSWWSPCPTGSARRRRAAGRPHR